MSEILGKAKTVRELLKGVKYSIDYYQREYRWGQKQVLELLNDLTTKFLEQYDPEKIPAITPGITKALQNYDWPGNVRELQNTIHRFITLKKLDFMGFDFADKVEQEGLDDVDFEDEQITLAEILDRYEKKVLAKALEKYNWHKTNVAAAFNIDRKTLFNKMKKYDFIS